MTIQSERPSLIPLTPAFLRASLERNLDEAERLHQLSLPGDWPDDADVLSLRLAQLEEDPSLQPWLLRAMSLRSSRVMVGHIGFHNVPGAPDLQSWSAKSGEFGFTVFPSFRRQGFAIEACQALMSWARQTHDVTRFVLSIRPDNAASQALAAKLGFVRIGSHIDEVDGFEEVFDLKD
jgi:ribosomal-protein-alanine N-acetyltransferase